jgi:hypothetical protein
MKKLLYLILFAILSGCTGNKAIDKAVLSAQNATQRIDTIFLGFRFGMTLKEVYEHITNLSKQGKQIIIADLINDAEYKRIMSLIANPDNCPDCKDFFYDRSIRYSKYIFTTSNGKEFTTYFSPYFYNGKLYRMCFCLYSKNSNIEIEDKEQIYKTYLQAKRKEFKEYYDDYHGIYYSILNNLVIKFYNNERGKMGMSDDGQQKILFMPGEQHNERYSIHVAMDYIDMVTEKKYNDETEKEKVKKIRETSSDF